MRNHSRHGARTKPLILLVDDAEDARDLYATYFEFVGHRVVCAKDGREAVAHAREHRPDLILMDVRMPGLSGTEAMRQLRQDVSFADVPIVALTAHALEEERNAMLHAGFDAVIAKPCLPDDLLRAVEAILASRRPEAG